MMLSWVRFHDVVDHQIRWREKPVYPIKVGHMAMLSREPNVQGVLELAELWSSALYQNLPP